MRKPVAELGPRANRTITRIEGATREIFQARGYGGTTIDDITRAAGVSRASFYTYFPSKREVLLSLGAESIRATAAIVREFERLPPDWRVGDVRRWVSNYFDLLDEHGSFSFAWTQAAQDDEEIRRAGMKGHLRMCRRMGVAMGAARGVAFDYPTEEGLLLFSLLERTWSYARLYDGGVEPARLEQEIAARLAAHLGRRRRRGSSPAGNGSAVV